MVEITDEILGDPGVGLFAACGGIRTAGGIEMTEEDVRDGRKLICRFDVVSKRSEEPPQHREYVFWVLTREVILEKRQEQARCRRVQCLRDRL